MELDSGISALLGALIGGGITLLGTWLQTKQQTTKDYISMAKDLGQQQYQKLKEEAIARQATSKKTVIIHPVESFIAYYIKFFELMRDKGSKVSNLKKLEEYRVNLSEHYESLESPIIGAD